MAQRNETAKATIYLDGKQAEAAIDALKQKSKDLKVQLEAAKKAGDTITMKKLESEIRSTDAASRSLLKDSFDVEKVLKNINKISWRDLEKAQKAVVNEMKRMERGTIEYAAKEKDLAKITAELGRTRGVMKQNESLWSRMGNGFNKYFAMATAAIASLTGAALTIKSATEAYAEHDDTMSDVMKTTRLTKEEVKALNKEFTNIDTRTTRENLNIIAEEGGRIGIVKDDILEFVNAMDIANVALSDSFSGGTEEIAATLGKLKFLFSETKNMGVEKAYMSIGSAINDLGADGVASEQNIAEFTTRLGALSDVLKPSIADALALGAGFEESGIQAEIASRAYSIVLNRAATETDAFARVMGMSTKQVEDLINTNPVDFFFAFAESLKGMNATETARTLDMLKINAEGANKVIGAAANNTDRFRQLLDLSNNSFREANSVIEEFNTKNTNAQAKLEKARKTFSDTQLELGERLAPAYSSVISKAGMFLKIVGALVEFVFKHGKTLAVAAVAIGTYTIAINAQIIATKTYNLLTTAATAITKGFNTAVKANPVGLLISLLTAAATAYFLFRNKTAEAKKAQSDFNEVVQQGNDLLASSKTLEERAAIAKNLSKEQLETLKSDLEAQVKNEDDFHAVLLQKLKKRLSEDAELKRINEARSQQNLTELQKINLNSQYTARSKFLALELNAENKTNQQRLTNLKKHLTNVNAELKSRPNDNGGPTGGEPADSKTALKALEIANQQRILELQKQYAAEENMQKFLHARLLANELAYLQAKEALETDESKKLELQTQIVVKQVEYNRATKEAIDALRLKKNVVEQINPKLLEEGKITARNARIAKQAADDQEALNDQLESQAQRYQDTITTISDGLYEMMSGSEDAFKTFAKNILIFALEQLKIQTQIAVAGATVQSLASPESVATFGAAGIAKAALLVGLIEAAFAVVEGLVNNAFTGKGKQAGGYGDTGYDDSKPAGIYHANEFIASAHAVRNPTVKPILDVIDWAQRTGTIRSLNLSAMIPGKQTGGYSSTSTNPQPATSNPQPAGPAIDRETATNLTTAINNLMKWKPKLIYELIEKGLDDLKEIETKR